MIASAAVRVRADFDQTVLGLVDPAHVPMVHTSWWWRPPSKPRRVKRKAYAPSHFGFTARGLDTFASAPLYRLAGSAADISIEFRLPGVRLERIAWAGRRLFNLTTVTPQTAGAQIIRNTLYGRFPGVRFLRCLLAKVAETFLLQDAAILERLEHTGRPHNHMFVGDPDMPSLWYFALKRELLAAQIAHRPFSNPVRPRTLVWRT